MIIVIPVDGPIMRFPKADGYTYSADTGTLHIKEAGEVTATFHPHHWASVEIVKEALPTFEEGAAVTARTLIAALSNGDLDAVVILGDHDSSSVYAVSQLDAVHGGGAVVLRPGDEVVE